MFGLSGGRSARATAEGEAPGVVMRAPGLGVRPPPEAETPAAPSVAGGSGCTPPGCALALVLPVNIGRPKREALLQAVLAPARMTTVTTCATNRGRKEFSFVRMGLAWPRT